VPTEYGANQYVNEFYNIRATVDGIELPFIVSLTFKHKVNSARTAIVTIENREALEMLRVGGELTISFGLSDAYANKIIAYEEGTSQGLVGSPSPNDFYGKIKIIKPGLQKTTFTALDLISGLATSRIDNIQYQDYGQQDMYMVAKDICDYQGIDVSHLDSTMKYGMNVTEGKLNKQYNIFGYQTRKSFLDKLFNLMSFNPNDTDQYKSSTTPSATNMSDPYPFVEFYYAIRQGKQMDFFAPNRYDKRAKPVLKIGPNEANIVGAGLVGSIDASKIINSVTISSDSNPARKVTVEDGSSIKNYGVSARNFEFKDADTTTMNEAAHSILNKFKEPTKTYTIELTGAEWVQLGDLVEISSPLLGTKELFPVVEKEISVTNSVKTRLAIGSASLEPKELLELMQR
tara:strand:+ start:321 stop:1526 length:1206 start_codon:yes stop_codon:yes gene_type:complete